MTTNSTPVIEIQNKHVTIRSFTDEPIPSKMLNTILEGGRRSPTSSNMQAYSVIVIKNPIVKQELAVLAGNQKHVETCPVMLAFCADLHRLGTACQMHDVKMTNNLETFLISTIDASLMGMSVQTGAESFGIGAVMIGAMRNHPEKVAELLGLPHGVYVVFGMCLGWPIVEKIPRQKPRLPRELVIHEEQYAKDDSSTIISSHDEMLAKHYESQGRNLDQAAWSGIIARNLSGAMRPDNLLILKRMGFDIDKM